MAFISATEINNKIKSTLHTIPNNCTRVAISKLWEPFISHIYNEVITSGRCSVIAEQNGIFLVSVNVSKDS